MRIRIASLMVAALPALAAPVHLVDQKAASVSPLADGTVLVDFERVAFGNVRLVPPVGLSATVTVHFGEAMTAGRIERKPPGTVRYNKATVMVKGGSPAVVAPPADKRNTTQPAAVLTPPEWGVVLPFRWIEIEGWPGAFKPEFITRQAAFATTWQDDAAAFASSDPTLDRIWELCRYSIKATTFCGVYVDGDRERIPYEADAYINQLCHYYCDPDPRMARDTFDWLMKRPTWPTEWAHHMIFIAHADWMQTGDRAWLAARYESLKAKLLPARLREDGLIGSNPQQVKRDDIVDWPAGERDGFVHTPVNTVVNAFHLRSLALMAELAHALGKDAEAAAYETREREGRGVFQTKCFDPARGLYRDGEATDHVSLHANLFPLAFGLVPEAARPGVAKWLAERGMKCSVYASQYFMEALFENGQDRRAMELILAPGDRGWRHMVESGTTITWEAWDQKYKPNQDWNHAWGAAPANLLPRYVLGVTTLEPGWKRASIRPRAAGLEKASGRIPTPRGPVSVAWTAGASFRLQIELPPGVSAQVRVPATTSSTGVWRDGRSVAASRDGAWWVIRDELTGRATLEAK